MLKTSVNMSSLTSEGVFDFFMKSEQFHGLELPEYFDFKRNTNFVRDTIGNN